MDGTTLVQLGRFLQEFESATKLIASEVDSSGDTHTTMIILYRWPRDGMEMRFVNELLQRKQRAFDHMKHQGSDQDLIRMVHSINVTEKLKQTTTPNPMAHKMN